MLGVGPSSSDPNQIPSFIEAVKTGVTNTLCAPNKIYKQVDCLIKKFDKPDPFRLFKDFIHISVVATTGLKMGYLTLSSFIGNLFGRDTQHYQNQIDELKKVLEGKK